jgi:hypothetical protein
VSLSRTFSLCLAFITVGCAGGGIPITIDAGPVSVLIAPAGTANANAPVDGISCDTSEQLLFHIHAHLAAYQNGVQKFVPPEIGIATNSSGATCFSWLHTHDNTGVIHIESPVQRVYTLGNFFHVWGQPLSSTQVGTLQGNVTAYYNGAPFAGDITSIPMNAHDLIQLDVGSTSPGPQPFIWSPDL